MPALKRPKPRKPGFRERVLGMLGVMSKKEVDHLIWLEEQVSNFIEKKAVSEELEELLQGLYNPFFGERWRAAWLIGELKDKKAVPILVKALRDTDPGVRFAVAGALRKIGGKEAKSALTSALKKEKTKFVEDEIKKALKKW